MYRSNADKRLSRREVIALAASQMLCLLADARAARSVESAARFKMSFDRDRFVEDCVVANRERDGQAAVREVLSRAVSEPATVLSRLGAAGKKGRRERQGHNLRQRGSRVSSRCQHDPPSRRARSAR